MVEKLNPVTQITWSFRLGSYLCITLKMPKVSKSNLGSIFGFTCPRCRKGSLYIKPFSWSTAYQMHSSCSECGQTYEPEPGFYYGAMFISYITTAWLFVIVGLSLAFGLGWSVTSTLIAVGVIAVVLHNTIFRFSRSLWLHLFVSYDPTIAAKSS